MQDFLRLESDKYIETTDGITPMNLKALSQHLGLSQTTVSRALNGYPEVSERTRERVMQAAIELNYRPNPNAKSLATGRTEHIGIILPIEQNLFMEPVFGEFMAGIAQCLAEADMDMTIMPTPRSNELQAYQQLAISGRVDGILISSPTLQDARVACLAESDFPFVLHGRTECAFPYSYLDIDNQGAFANATRLLLDLGHQRISLVNGDESMTFARDRHAGYRQALQEHGVTYDPQLVCSQGSMTEEHGFNSVSRLLLQRPRPSAFIVGSMILALGAMRAIRHHGLEPGHDIALIAHDDHLPYLQADKFDPPLTTTSSSIRAAGYEITQVLHAEINNKGMGHSQTVLPVELIVRGSTRTYKRPA